MEINGKSYGKEIPDSVIDYFSGYQIEPKDLDFISKQMSMVRIKKLSGKTAQIVRKAAQRASFHLGRLSFHVVQAEKGYYQGDFFQTQKSAGEP